MIIEKWIDETNKVIEIFGSEAQPARPLIICKDGFIMSVQTEGATIYAKFVDSAEGRKYIDLDVSEISREEILLNPYEFTYKDNDYEETIYAHVPIQVVEKVIIKHGGIADNVSEFKPRRQYINKGNY